MIEKGQCDRIYRLVLLAGLVGITFVSLAVILTA